MLILSKHEIQYASNRKIWLIHNKWIIIFNLQLTCPHVIKDNMCQTDSILLKNLQNELLYCKFSCLVKPFVGIDIHVPFKDEVFRAKPVLGVGGAYRFAIVCLFVLTK
jgi:hypothetical protein